MANEQPPDETPTRAITSASAARSSWRGSRLWALIAAAVAVVVAVVLVVVLVFDKNKPAGNGEVFLESAESTGQNPFTPTVASPQPPGSVPGLGPAPAPQSPAPQSPAPQSPAPQSPTAAPAAVRTVSGGEPGLYGGTRDISTCDKELLINFLGQNPDKGAAWAGVLGIAPTQIRDYVGQLTPVLLRTDTRVTNHGFANGKAYALQSVLQAGTAVLIDRFGAPRVRCECGNPLLEPQPVPSTPHYIGQRWYWFNELTVIVVVKTTVMINVFILFDWGCGCYFRRGPGTPDEPPCPEPPRPCPEGQIREGDVCMPPPCPPGTAQEDCHVGEPGGTPQQAEPPGGRPPGPSQTPYTGPPIKIPGKN